MNEPGIVRFICEGRSLTLEPGRITSGLPTEHIVDAAGKHISIAYRERTSSILFDMDMGENTRIGFRLSLENLQDIRFPHKSDYWKARDAAGWPARRKARA